MANFDLSLPYVLKNEGGECNLKNDSGGHTNMGVTQETLDAFNLAHPECGLPANVHDLTRANVGVIFKVGYWRFDWITSDNVACKILDMDVNDGLPSGIKLAQRAVNRLGGAVQEDGCIGPATIAAINACEPTALLQALCVINEEHYEAIAQAHPEDEEFLAGWLARAREVPNVA